MKVSFIIPCHNEEASIGAVIQSIKKLEPLADIFVCDNASTDLTSKVASEAGANVLYEPKKGKGNAVRRLFRDVQSDIYVLIDGDNTYSTKPISHAIHMVAAQGFDMVVGERVHKNIKQRSGHRAGNIAYTWVFRLVFGVDAKDVFSGLRIMSRRLVKTFPSISPEFEIEAELEIYSARMRLPVRGIPVEMSERVGTVSKLNTYRDGFKIGFLAARMIHREYPFMLYSCLSILLIISSASLFIPIYNEYITTGLVPRIPTVVACSSLAITAILALMVGIVLKEITNSRYETRYLAYLARGKANN